MQDENQQSAKTPEISPPPGGVEVHQTSETNPPEARQPASSRTMEHPGAQSQPPTQRHQQRDDRRNQQRQRSQRQRPFGSGRQEGQQPQRDGGKELSIIVPLYNEEQSLRELYGSIRNALNRMGRHEIIFVDDGSTDGSMRVLHELRHRDRRVKIIRFRRNFGKSAALSVGFSHATGNIVVTMDADLQDDPNEIPNLVNEIKKGYDLVSGWKRKRRDPLSKTIPSRFFNFVTSLLTGIKLHDFNCGLKAYRKDVVKEVKVYGELHRYIPVLAHWQGYKITEIPVQHHARKYGKTKFGIQRFWKGFLDLITVLFTTRYLQRPLHLFGFWGLVFFVIGFAIDLYLVILKFVEGEALGNRPLFVGGILLIIVGVQFISLGLLGEMITKMRQPSDKEYSVREIWK
jgi:glycosyltransferase involved in cell wall biosynthesis